MNLEQRRLWNQNHKALTGILAKPGKHEEALELFLQQHALLYSSGMERTDQGPTFEDDLMANLREETFRQYPVQAKDTKNAIAWHLWHIARVEDITMNILVADTQQVLLSGDWVTQLGIGAIHSGNGMDDAEMVEFSRQIAMSALTEYRIAVGRRTREIIRSLEPRQLAQKVQADRLQRISDEGAVKEEAAWLQDYWSGKTIAGLVLMPATRHNFLHLNKSLRLKQKMQK